MSRAHHARLVDHPNLGRDLQRLAATATVERAHPLLPDRLAVLERRLETRDILVGHLADKVVGGIEPFDGDMKLLSVEAVF